MKVKTTIKDCQLEMVTGDITKETTEAIVNAANSSLMGGGGVDGAIHRSGGPVILEECKKIRERQGKLPTGEAVITTGGNLKAKYVIHTVGPVWQGGNNNEARLLANAYQNSLQLARDKGIKSVSFPSISTGAYRFPVKKASGIALFTIKNYLIKNNGFDLVRMVLFSEGDFQKYLNAWENIVINNRKIDI